MTDVHDLAQVGYLVVENKELLARLNFISFSMNVTRNPGWGKNRTQQIPVFFLNFAVFSVN
jgi:hypothetical protein